jgi:large subunit ribosomal protein L30
MVYAVIRVRGHPDVKGDISRTMDLLRLTRVNHCVLVPEDAVTKGMLIKAKDYITWGEITSDTVQKLIEARGRLMGDRTIDDEYLKENSDFSSISDLAKGVADGTVRYADLLEVKPLFRLSPPVKGYEGNKRSFKSGGALGYRGEAINELIQKML